MYLKKKHNELLNQMSLTVTLRSIFGGVTVYRYLNNFTFNYKIGIWTKFLTFNKILKVQEEQTTF